MKIEAKGDKITIMDFNEFDAFRIAAKVEKDGLLFYAQLAAGVKKPEAKEVLEFLLGEEKKHLKFFEGQLDRLRQLKEDTNEDDDLLSALDFGVFQPYQNLKGLEDLVTNIPKALRLGLIIEDKSIQFYHACSQNLSAQGAKEELANIIAEEKGHKALLERIIAGLPKSKA